MQFSSAEHKIWFARCSYRRHRSQTAQNQILCSADENCIFGSAPHPATHFCMGQRYSMNAHALVRRIPVVVILSEQRCICVILVLYSTRSI
eukprot:COSAG02_NODE_95_length_37416_cov_60.512742_31_plen_91_part_00